MDINFSSTAGEDIYENIRLLFTEAVRKRLMAHRRIGCMLSGEIGDNCNEFSSHVIRRKCVFYIHRVEIFIET